MKIDSLDELEAAFAGWRRKKKHVRESMPEELRSRARRAAQRHGVKAVVGVTGVERSRLFRPPRTRRKGPGAASTKARAVAKSTPSFSRLEVSAPSAPSPRPIAEVESRSGVTLRVFEQTPEMMRLLSAVCGFGGVR